MQYPGRRAFPSVAAFAATLSLLAPALAFAQAAAPVLSPKPAAVAVEDVVQLSAFNVTSTQDSGYAAMNSTSATRIDMPIKDIPVNISVVTRQFLDDSLAFDFRDALNYNAGVITRRDDKTAIIIRGFGAGESFVNGFRRIDYLDASSLERVEIIRGPAAVLYGITAPGGTVNSVTKKPVYGRTFAQARATAGTYAFRRVEADINAPLGRRTAFRFVGAHQTSDGYGSPDVEREFDVDTLNVITPSFAWQPFPTTNLTVELEHMRFDKSNPEEILTQSVGGRNVPVSILHGYPIGKTFKGPWLLDKIESTATTVILDQKISDGLSVRLSGYGFDYHWPRGGLGTFSFVQGNGQPWADPVTGAPSWRARWSESIYQWNRVYSYRADAVWKFDLRKTKHQILVGGQYYEATHASRTAQDYVPGTRTVKFRYFPLADKSVVPQRPSDIDYQPQNAGLRNRDENTQLYAVHTGRWFDEKLITLAGIFRIEIDNINRAPNPAGANQPPAQHASLPPTFFRNRQMAPQLGFLYKPSERFSYYTLYSESVEPVGTGRNDKNGNPLAPVFSEGFEAGVKVDLTQRLLGTVALYRTEIQNSVASNENLPNPFNPTADPNISPRGAFEQVGKRLVTGWNVDFVWSPTRQLQARAGWQHTFKNEITEDTDRRIIGRLHGRHIRDFVTLFGRYDFDRNGAWRGFSTNLGVQYRGKQLREYPAFANGAPTWFDGYWSADAAVRYEKKIGDHTYSLALNGKNLLQREAPIG